MEYAHAGIPRQKKRFGKEDSNDAHKTLPSLEGTSMTSLASAFASSQWDLDQEGREW